MGSRVLTSVEGLAILCEKEDKKKKEEEEGKRRKKERSEKGLKRKREKEELAKKEHHNHRDSQNGLVKDWLLQGPLTKWKAHYRH